MNISYHGQCTISEYFQCEICSGISKHKFIAVPSIKGVADWDSLNVCKKCAVRETTVKKVQQLEDEYELR